jgi:hypothetical protein
LTGYTALSRHQMSNWLVVDEASVRRRVHAQNLKTGDVKAIGLSDVWNKIGEEMSRQPMKASALDMLSRVTEVRRGSVARFQRSMEMAARFQSTPGLRLSSFERARLAIAPVMRQALDYAREMTQGSRWELRQTRERRHAQSHEQHGPHMGL